MATFIFKSEKAKSIYNQETTYYVSKVAGSGEYNFSNDDVHEDTFRTPKSLAILNGAILISDFENQVIRKIDNGQVLTFAGNGLSGSIDGTNKNVEFYYPQDLAVAKLKMEQFMLLIRSIMSFEKSIRQVTL